MLFDLGGLRRSFVWGVVLAPFVVFQPSAHSANVALPDFYQKVTTLKAQGKLGQVLAQEKIPTTIPGAQAWRIAYVSSDYLDRPTLSTGLVIAPISQTKTKSRPILAWAHGTTGTAQNCGPSQVQDPAQSLNQYFLVGGTSWTDFGVPAAEEFIKDGYVLVATDYQGLGGGGIHQYALAATQAHDVINSIRAVGSMGLSGSTKNALIYGWSQGGGAVIAAASMAKYINLKRTAFDGIHLVGAVALAPPDVAVMAPEGALDEGGAKKYLASISQSFTNDVFNFTHYAMTMWALSHAVPKLQLTDVFTEDGVKAANEIFGKKCMHVAADTMNFTFGTTYKQLMKPQPTNAQSWVKAMIESSVSPVKPVAPVIIYWGTKDTAVPPVMGELYQKQMCKLGGNVARVQLAGEQSHFSTPPAAQPMFVKWIKDRLNGTVVSKGCVEN